MTTCDWLWAIFLHKHFSRHRFRLENAKTCAGCILCKIVRAPDLFYDFTRFLIDLMYVKRLCNIEGCVSLLRWEKVFLKTLNFRDGKCISTAYRISCSNEVLETDLKTSRLIWLIITLLGSCHFACNDFVTKVGFGCGPII